MLLIALRRKSHPGARALSNTFCIGMAAIGMNYANRCRAICFPLLHSTFDLTIDLCPFIVNTRASCSSEPRIIVFHCFESHIDPDFLILSID
jgi:hypothetical protein